MQRQASQVDLASRQVTLSSEEFLIELFRCFLRAVAELDSPIMRGVFLAVAEQKRLVDTISSYWTQDEVEGETCTAKKASIIGAALHAFIEESSRPPVAHRLPPMFGPPTEASDRMDDKVIAAVWVAVFFCLPTELLTIYDNDKTWESSPMENQVVNSNLTYAEREITFLTKKIFLFLGRMEEKFFFLGKMEISF